MHSPPAANLVRVYDETARALQAEPKSLPAVWLYDERGSQLYNQITKLPEYYLPRSEREILRTHGRTIAERTRARTLVDLGAGGARNTRYLLDALEAEGTLEQFVPLDVSEEMLHASSQAIAAEYPDVVVTPLVGDFERDLDVLHDPGQRLIALLGSTIGNFEATRRARFLAALAGALADDDALLLGLDLVKDPARLEAAYNDAAGVTEAFVRNALDAVNRELGATFDQSLFAYEARWDAEHEWMAIGFRALRAHSAWFPRLHLDVAFAEGEPLQVEISAKFRRDRFEREAARAGLHIDSWWTDDHGDFAVAVLFPRKEP